MENIYYSVIWYENGEFYGFNKFYSLKAAKAFIKLITLDRIHHAEKTGKKLTYEIIKREG